MLEDFQDQNDENDGNHNINSRTVSILNTPRSRTRRMRRIQTWNQSFGNVDNFENLATKHHSGNQKLVLVVDACFAGTWVTHFHSRYWYRSDIVIQAASNQYQTSGAHRGDPGTSVFTSNWITSTMTTLILNSHCKLRLQPDKKLLRYFRDLQTPKFVLFVTS